MDAWYLTNKILYNSYSIMGANIKLFKDKHCMDERNVYAIWRGICEKNEDVIRVCIMYAGKRASWYEG